MVVPMECVCGWVNRLVDDLVPSVVIVCASHPPSVTPVTPVTASVLQMFPFEVQFGHAGALANSAAQTAEAKNAYVTMTHTLVTRGAPYPHAADE
jgi:hypothetical protein